MASKSKYNISREMEPWPTSPNDFNKLTKYLETNKQYEDNSNYKYMYFKNNESASNKILQVAITTDLERDLELADAIKETRESEEEFIENFYKYKREYYIIDTNSNTKKKLDCNNLIYEAIDNVNTIQESILLFSNENIPFYDSNETGYFDWEGNKVRLNKPYLVYDCIDKYAVVYDKSAYKTFLISLKTGEVEKEFQGNAIKYKNFYILKPYSYLGNYIVLDKEFNKIAESNREPHIVDENVVSVSTKENINYVYMYENGKLTEKYKSQSKRFLIQSTMPLYTSSSNIYENLELNKE